MSSDSKPAAKTILEIRVDRANEKGVFVAEQILNILHDTIDENNLNWRQTRQKKLVDFSCEIANIGGVIRFFFITDPAFKELIENQIYAHYPNVEITEVAEYLPQEIATVGSVNLSNWYIYPIKIYSQFKERTEKESVDPYSSLTSALAKAIKKETLVIQINFTPLLDAEWKDDKKVQLFLSNMPDWYKNLRSSSYGNFLGIFFSVLSFFLRSFVFLIQGMWKRARDSGDFPVPESVTKKFEWFGFATSIRIASFWGKESDAKLAIRQIASAFTIFSHPDQNGFRLSGIEQDTKWVFALRNNMREDIVNSAELAGLVHFPTLYVKTPSINWVTAKKLEPPYNLPLLLEHQDAIPVGITNFRGSSAAFGLLPNDRRRHMYIIGKTGMGKTTILENMIYDDIKKGRGVAIIDPHGDLADTLISNIPKSRTNDVILFDPSDQAYPIAFNMFDNVRKDLQPIVASGLISIFKKMFSESWGPRLEYILRNTILTLLLVPDSTIMSIPLMLTLKSFRQKVVAKLEDPILAKFWTSEFEVMDSRQMTEAVSPILNKVGQFLSSSLLRNMLGQPKNAFTLRWLMDNQKIFIVNLSKGLIGEDASQLLGAMMVTKFQIDAMSRADVDESERKDFYLYVDEFQNFATDSFAVILSEARKYRLNLVMANQYIEQITETVREAVFGNVGSLLSFQLGAHDADHISEAMNEEIVTAEDLLNLRKYDIYTKILIDGMPSRVFSATTFPPIRSTNESLEQKKDVVLRVNREKYARPVDFVEKKIYEFNTRAIEAEKKYRDDIRKKKESAGK